MGIQDRIPGTGVCFFFFWSVELGFRISIVSGISDSSRCIADFKAQDLGFQIRRAKIFRTLESVFPYKRRVYFIHNGDVMNKIRNVIFFPIVY